MGTASLARNSEMVFPELIIGIYFAILQITKVQFTWLDSKISFRLVVEPGLPVLAYVRLKLSVLPVRSTEFGTWYPAKFFRNKYTTYFDIFSDGKFIPEIHHWCSVI